MTTEPARPATGARVSVRVRILAVILLLALLGLAVAGGSAFFAQRGRVLAAVDERLTSVVASVEGFATDTPATGQTEVDGATIVVPPRTGLVTTSDLVELVMASIVLYRNEDTVGIIDGAAAFFPAGDHTVSLGSDPALVARFVDETADGQVVIGTAVTPTQTVRYVAIPMQLEGSAEVGVYVSALDLTGELQPLYDTFTTYAIVALVALAVTAIIGWLVAGRLLRPIRRLREAADSITITDLAGRIPVRGRDDLSQLTETMNGMLDRLEASVTAQQHLLDDVRHELNTPLTIIRGHLELLDTTDADEVSATRDLTLDELERMERLIADIELLAGSGRPLVTPETVDIGALTRQVHEKASAIPGHGWLLERVADVPAAVDPQRITQAWLQLCDNAAKYAPAGTPIALGSAVTEAGDLELWVTDRGSGIAADAQARIFERFGRANTGRGIRGSGLGLPIVAAIAAAHGGRVDLASAEGIGSRFSIVIPLSGGGKDTA